MEQHATPVPARDEKPPKRCVACGFETHLVYEPRCPRCGVDFPPDSVTSDDGTPFAMAVDRGGGGRRAMRRWVYLAGVDRLRHLSLARASAASTQFARGQLFRLAGAAAIFELSRSGWHHVVRTAENVTRLTTAPSGGGWWRVAVADAAADRLGLVGVWWNPARGGIALTAAVITGLIAAYGVLLILNIGAWWVVGRPFRDEGRLRAAVHYSTAWGQSIVYAACVMVLVPIAGVLNVDGVRFIPTTGIDAVASLLVGTAGLAWWFWLVRLGYTLPAAARSRTMAYYAVVAPLLIGGLLVGWRAGLDALFGYLWPLLDLTW